MDMDFTQRGPADGLGDAFQWNIHKRKYTDKVRIIRRAAGQEITGCCNTSNINDR